MPPAANPLQESFKRLQAAEQLRRERKFEQAQVICESLIQQYPNYAGALHTLGLVYSDQNKNEYALDCLVRALMLNPRNGAVLTALGQIYLRFGANEMAALTLERTKSIEPLDPKALLMLGDIYQEDQEYERARDTYREALAIKPDLVPASIGFGWCCYYLGDYAEASKIFQSLVERGLRLLEPIRALTVLPASTVKVDVMAQLDMATKEPDENEAEFKVSVEFFRAIILDRAGRHAEAWQHFTRANRAVFLTIRDRLCQISQRWRTSIELLRASPGSTGRPVHTGQPVSLFILGPSRSGKTTLEQIVGTLGGVKRGYESSTLWKAVQRTFQASALLGSNQLELLPPHLHQLFREYYFEELRRLVRSARVFTDTSPGHIHSAALIATILPSARFIFVKRNLEDNVLRIYMARYRGGNAYAYDLKTARDHILQYHELIDLMAEKFPNIVRVIQYEDMVGNPAAALAMTAELCGLPIGDEPAPAIASDCGCAAPYRQFMAAELGV